jgi:hypothetical protein
MDVSQGSSLCNYLKPKKGQFVSAYKIGEQEGRIGFVWRSWYQWMGEDVGKGHRRVDMVQTL